MIRKAWKFFCSVKLTIVLFVLILVPSIIGTVIQQNAPDPSRYVEIYGPVWDSIFRRMGFYDIYHASHFIVLLILLGLNTLACTLNRFRLRWKLLGMLMTHFGLLLILAGALAGAMFGVRGFIGIREGETADQIATGRASGETRKLHFELKLVDFILVMHEEPTHKLLVFDVKTRKQQSRKIEEGLTVLLSEPRWSGLASLVGIKPKASGMVRVKRFVPNAAVVTSLTEGPDETGVAAMEFRIMSGESEEQGFALSQIEHPYLSHKAHLGVGYATLASRDLIEGKIQEAMSLFRMTKHLELTLPDGAPKKIFPAEAGSAFEIEGTAYSVEVLRYVADFSMDLDTREIVSKSDFPNNPAVHVKIDGPSGSIERWVFAKLPSVHESKDVPFESKFKMDEHLSGVVDYVLVLNVSDGEPVLARFRGGELLGKADIHIGRLLDIEGTDYSIVVDGFFENASMSREIVNNPDMPGWPAIEVEVEQGGSSTPYFLWKDEPVDAPGYKMMYIQEEKVRDFYSVLQVIDAGKVVAEKKIEVNDPLRYGGYTIYQNRHDQENPDWSGLEVKKDPGVSLVYAGFLLQILGMILVFYINPLLTRAKRSRA